MSSHAVAPIAVDKRAIPSWLFVTGVFVHFVVPAYLLAVPILCLLAAPRGAGWRDLIGLLPMTSLWFLGGYAALGLASVVAARLLDPVARWRRSRRIARDPHGGAAASRQRLARAVADGRRLLDDRSRKLLETLRRAGWDHADPRVQALSNDLSAVVQTSTAALASAAPDRRPALRGLATESLERIAVALGELNAERARLDEGDAMVVARYVRLRHTQSDSAGGPI